MNPRLVLETVGGVINARLSAKNVLCVLVGVAAVWVGGWYWFCVHTADSVPGAVRDMQSMNSLDQVYYAMRFARRVGDGEVLAYFANRPPENKEERMLIVSCYNEGDQSLRGLVELIAGPDWSMPPDSFAQQRARGALKQDK